ncbi:hypothetical protein [Geothrix sp. 21YS21S-2]|uniref:hypothetical protein n=1 Tax=Geothrix sp. 21YS21S-2 TaxID=3068893 RepID=UPI0027BA4BE0|nr:hypothetical protein [Geothrix sp. 21YS21S-2]
MPTRPKLLKITLTYEQEGRPVTVEVDPAKASALFWTDHTVENLLGSYYRSGLPNPTGQTPSGVLEAWNTAKADGTLPVVMIKYPECGTGPI